MQNRKEEELMENWNPNQELPLLSVVCITYGQEKYIAQAIDSILMQVTNFKFEIIIGEDCSPDNTREILLSYEKKYPNIITLLCRENNIGVSDNADDCIRKTKGKYIAILEGDDFWVDTSKLQKQVDFLNSHLDYGLVHSDVNHQYEKDNSIINSYNKTNNIKIPSGDIYHTLLEPSHIIKTMTVCFRKELLEKYYFSNDFIMNSSWKLVDISIWLMFAQHSKIHYFDEVFSTYRLCEESMSRSNDVKRFYQFHQKIIHIRFFYLRTFSTPPALKEKLFKWYYQGMLTYGYSLKNRRLFFRGKIGLSHMGYTLTAKERVKLLVAYFFD